MFTTVVRSDSMRPALQPGDVLLGTRVRRRTRLRHGEILVYRVPEEPGTRIRRLIAVPGDRVRIEEDGGVSVNGEAVFEPYARRSGGFRGSFGVPDDRYFALSDRREGLLEPLAWRQSFVPTGDVVGVARVRLLPWPIAGTGVLAR
ncbi:signal peptidase I [Agromyces sp. ZXT2-6]|uniref:signal peptidase I n=1 Tax=Agromyces sp. ZXT2-6 TaxID=3461153 RepID=UPI004054F61A